MDKKLKRRWLALLRSGTIEKHMGFYEGSGDRRDARCALGVLALNILGLSTEKNPIRESITRESRLQSSEQRMVEVLNDNRDSCNSFEDIADWIELNIKED